MDDALYMLVVCTALSCGPPDKHWAYSLSLATCIEQARDIRRQDPRKTAQCRSNCGDEVVVGEVE